MFKSHVTITDEFYFRGLRNSKPPNLYFFSRPSVLKDNVYPQCPQAICGLRRQG